MRIRWTMVAQTASRPGFATRTLHFLRESTPAYADWPLRIMIAAVFLFHGISKLDDGVAGFADAMGLSIGLAWLVTLGEIAAGALVLVGGLVIPGAKTMSRFAGALVAIIMVGAIVKVHWPRWAFDPTDDFPMGGMEFQVVLAAIGLWFFATGGRLVKEVPR